MVLVAVGVVTGRSFHSPVVVRVLPEEVDSLNSLGAYLSISRHPLKGVKVEYTDSPAVVVDRSLVKEEARSLEVGEVHSPEAGIAVVEDSHVAGPGRERKTWLRSIARGRTRFLLSLPRLNIEARVR